ncbi:hypothetical protein [Reyranella sp.]|uniref:hypothetical protein n=1 Tax=Reyranella sp. TaxID=1929291 RepID=UPI003BAA3052
MALLVAVLGAGCTYPDDELVWGNCCALKVADETSGSKQRETLIAWGRVNNFQGDGTNSWNNTQAWRSRQIGLGLADFRKAHPGSQGPDYLAHLGMTCTPSGGSKADPTRCEVELSVWARCVAKLGMLFPAPVPEELRKPIAAVLQMTIDVSGSDILASSVQVVPLPGGRLCHR